MWKEDYLPDGGCIGKQHDQSVDADALTGGRGHPILQCLNIIVIHPVSFLIAGIPSLNLLGKTLMLVDRIIKFRKSISDLTPGDKKLKSFGEFRFLIATAGQRRNFRRVVLRGSK